MARRRDDDDDDDDDDRDDGGQHPALTRGYSRFKTQAMHTITSIAKYALIGGLIGGALLGVGSLLLGGMAVAALGPIGWILSAVGLATGTGTGFVMGAIGSAVTTGLTYGALAGAAVGGVVGITGSGSAADEAEDRLIAKYEQAQARNE